MPKPFLNKLIVHGAIGFFCVLFGCIYGFITYRRQRQMCIRDRQSAFSVSYLDVFTDL